MIENTNKILAYLHCGLCAEEFKNHEHKGKSMQSMKNYDVGYTKRGLQVWCVKHDCNIIHIDFEGIKHKANLTRPKIKGFDK